MPLPTLPIARDRLHTRRIVLDAYRRDDGMFDIEGRLTDTKAHDYVLLTGLKPAGVPIHDMLARVTIDRAYVIHDVEVKVDDMPYRGACNRIESAYRELIGTNLRHGFRKSLYAAMGGVQGCSHITELFAQLPTAAIQMFAGLRREIEPEDETPFQLDRCHALETTTDTVRRYYPRWYKGAI
jgi:Protein of unknown function (DUF2889)